MVYAGPVPRDLCHGTEGGALALIFDVRERLVGPCRTGDFAYGRAIAAQTIRPGAVLTDFEG
jgi:hypothetical protein